MNGTIYFLPAGSGNLAPHSKHSVVSVRVKTRHPVLAGPAALMPEIDPVGKGFISVFGNQAQRNMPREMPCGRGDFRIVKTG